MLSTDSSKALDCLRRNLLIAKLAAYCFGQPSLCFIYSYLSDRTQRTKVSMFTVFILMLNMVFHKLLYQALCFLILINCNLFLWGYKCNIARNANDNTLYTSDIRSNLVLEKVESSTHDLFRGYKESHMKVNLDKCHLLVTINALIFNYLVLRSILNSLSITMSQVSVSQVSSICNHVSNQSRWFKLSYDLSCIKRYC